MKNKISLDSLCAALSVSMGTEIPKYAAAPCEMLAEHINENLSGEKLDRIFMFNPDAIGQWIFEKYNSMFDSVLERTDLKVPFCTVMPSVTPVCFGTMYTGALPEVHGIKSYVKPVITIDTLFDALIRSGKKPVIVSTTGDSMSKIYLERDMDYYILETVEEVNEKAHELILSDEYDFIAVYNGNYDTVMHKFGPESREALLELRKNIESFVLFSDLISQYWKAHNTLIGFAMDHGCHEIDGNCGSHGLDMEEDLNIVHLYKVQKAK